LGIRCFASALLARALQLTAGRFEDILDTPVLLALPPFELVETPREFFVGGKELAEADEGAHDGNVHFNGALAG
jgi:hypothetical protein